MRKILSILILALFVLISANKTYAYTSQDVATHNTPTDCWAIFDGGVYDLTTYLKDHDRYLDIRDWCGKDMTNDYKDKGGEGVDHKTSSYALLETYKIGDIDVVTEPVAESTNTAVDEVVKEDTVTAKPREYNMIVPFLLSVSIYWISYFLVKKDKLLGVKLVRFNGFWNTILLLTLLIPSLGFGVFMVIRTKKPELWDIDFEFMYWHVELSLVMGILGINHFLQRFVIYLKQIGK